jgi:hypothetical protein
MPVFSRSTRGLDIEVDLVGDSDQENRLTTSALSEHASTDAQSKPAIHDSLITELDYQEESNDDIDELLAQDVAQEWWTIGNQ